MTKPVWTLDQIVANLDRADIAWVNQPITYSFLNAVPAGDDGDPAFNGFNAFTAGQRTPAQLALSLYSDVANVSFVQGADSASSTNKITFANSSTIPDYAWGFTQIASGSQTVGGEQSIDSAEIWVNFPPSNGTYGNGTYNFMALMHEIGHALGLSHAGDYNADGSTITYADNAEYQQDSLQYSIMSYFDASNTGAYHADQYASTPLVDDVAALQAIYGANMATRSGDTVYGFGSTAGLSAFNFSLTPKPVVAIWDGGGIDTINLSGYSSGCNLDLNEGAFSDVGGLTKNLAICFGVTIENATGSFGNDVITGNAVGNTIIPVGGDDTVYGGDGDDTINIDSGELTNADTLYGGNGTDTLWFNGSTLSLENIYEVETIHVISVWDFFVPESVGSITLIQAGQPHQNIDASNTTANALTLEGTDDGDVLRAGFGNFTLLPGAGPDTLSSKGLNCIFAFAMADLTSADTIDLSQAIDGTGTIRFLTSGTLSADQLSGVMAVKTYEFADGNDTFVTPNWMSGMELDGGGGNDYFDISAMPTGDGYGDAVVSGGGGNDTLTGGAGDDTLNGGAGGDTLVAGSGDDTLAGGTGGDDFLFDGNLSTADVVRGDAGFDTIILDGDYNLVFSATMLTAVEGIHLNTGHDYTLTFDDANVASGKRLIVNGMPVGSANAVTIDGSHETNGKFTLTGGAGADHLTGGALGDKIGGSGGNDVIVTGAGTDMLTGGMGADILNSGTGPDTYVYGAAKESTGAGYDTLIAFNALGEHIDLATAVTGIDAEVTAGMLSTATFDTNLHAILDAAHLVQGHAVLVTPDSGDLAGQKFLVVEMNGVAGYQAGKDLVLHLDSATHLGDLSVSDFI